MKPGELLRIRVAFGALSAVPIFLAGWLGWVQVAQAGTLERASGESLPLSTATADRQGWRVEKVPAPRGTVTDRDGVVLAADCATYEVRARITVPLTCRRDLTLFRPWVKRIVDGFSLALVADPDLLNRAAVRAKHRKRLMAAVKRAWALEKLPTSGTWPKKHSQAAEFLVSGGVDRLMVIDALRDYHMSDDFPTIALDFLHGFRRVYPERDLTHGIVGHCNSYKVKQPNGGFELKTYGMCGLESFLALEPRQSSSRRYLADGHKRPYFIAPVRKATRGAVLQSTIDLELQRAAVRELTAMCEAGIRNNPEKKAQWGSLVLVELDTGDVLASASWHRGKPHPQAKSYTPYQNLFEPGSIVKPLVLSYAYEVGALDWEHEYDCNPRHADYRERIGTLGRRVVKDDHDCGVLTAHGILLNSSNIGAAYIGLQLTREQWQDYMAAYGFGRSLGLNLPWESLGGNHPDSFASNTSLRSFRLNSAISFSFGYEMTATAMQVARAYRRMFKGLGAELRLVRGLEIDGQWHPVPVKRDTGPHYRPEVVEAVRRAMTDVVSNDPHATGHHLHAAMLTETGVDLHGLIGGKTGTAATDVRSRGGKKISARNASFVGFLPADNPRWLAVCVLQKDDSARFYGGSYAAPPAVKLLLQCQNLAERGPLRQESRPSLGGQTQLSLRGVAPSGAAPSGVGIRSPGSQGWSAPVGGGVPSDTR